MSDIQQEFEKAYLEENPVVGKGSFNKVLYDRKKESALWAAKWMADKAAYEALKGYDPEDAARRIRLLASTLGKRGGE